MEMIVAEGFRLSPQQGRLWELQKDGEQPYRSVCTVRLEGPLAPQRFQAAVERVVARHEILRTTFRIPPAMALPLQVIEEGGGIAFRHYDLRGLDSVTKEARLAGLMSDMDRLAFDLAGGPLLHVTVASLSLSEHRLLIALPTLCADVASLRNLVRELGEAHQGLDQEDPVQYADIAEALNELLESEETAAGREYWRQLRMPEARAKLPFESASVAGRGPWPARIVSGVEPDLWASVKLLARQSKCSLPTVLLSAWAALLVRLTGETEQTIAVGYDGRTYEGLDKACGLFARDLPVRCEFQADLPFAAALVTVELEKSVAGRWQDSFSWGLLAASERAAKAVDLPFAFDFEDAATSFAIGDLMFHVDRLTGVASRPKLRLVCRVQDDEVAIELDYDGSVLRAVDVRLAAERFLILLRDAVDHPEKPVGELRFLAVGERHQIVLELNDTERNHLGEECLHRLVEGQCDRTPCLTAVAFADRTLTYAELDADANQLARKLIRMGVGPNGIVAICMERSLEMVVSLLGVLKAGGAYLPLDPSYPAERLSSILADAMPSLVLGQERLRHALPHDRVPFIAVDMEAEANREEFSLRPTTSVDGDDLAYVIYTSGSTGHPKGVMVSHRAIRNRLLWMRDNHPLAAGDRVLQKTPHSFDASIWEFFLPLVCGARLVMAQPDGHQDSSYLVRAVIEHEITVLQLVPSMLRVVVEERELAACACLRRVFCGGEALTGDLIDKLSARIDAELHNLYGPTEAAIDVAHWICHPEDRKGIVPIGRPLDNVRIHLLDGRLEPAPFGVAGELYIGGVNLARGYLGRPDLTAERFVPDRFGLQSGGRLYRTGDLVRRRPDGTLDFLGRIDHQVKVRGFRIELGEIEAILRRHSAVSNAVVTLREDSPGKPRLVAYYVTSADAEVSAAELRDLAQRVLPAYMVPGVFVRLRALPVLPNGKLNHRALPPPDENLLGAGADSGDFQSLTEQVLVTIWSDLLAIDRVGIHDNFFALGGHSLAATQMAARLRSVFGAEVSLRTFFDRPTIAELAGVIEQARLAGRGLLSPPIVPAGRNRDLPLSFAQQRLWFLDQLQPGNPAYNIRLANRLVGKLSPGVLRQTLQEIVRRHESLRTTIQGVGGQPIQAIAPDLEVLLPVVDLRGIPEAKRDALTHELAAEESRRTFDLSQGPLIRATLLQTLGEEHLALITMHHVIGDGWSTGVLVREVAEIYLAFSHGLPSPLPELPIQYADFACWQREWLTGEILEAQLAFWRERLADLPVLQLPTDHPRPTIQSVRGAAHPLRLDRELTEGLKALGRRQGASLFMTLLAGFSALLSRHTGSRDLAVGCPVANRTRAEVENLIGFFANTLVLRTDLSGDPPFRALLKRASEGVLEASVYQDLPFERLVDALQVERDLSQNPLFQVMLVVQNAPKRVIEIAGLTMSSLLLQTGTAKFDLTLDFTETSAGLYGVLEYNADLFEPATLERMAGHLVTLLQGAAAEPDLLLSELPLLTGAEANQMLVLWNDTGTAYPDGLLHTLIEAQVARSPRAVALEFAGECLSYEALDRQANQLAHALLARGVQADQPVAVLAERSVEMVVALLAILKAGGAYMPLDPDYPRERLAFMLNDARPRVLLTQDRLMELVPEQAAQVFCLTPEGRELAGFPDHPPAVPLSPDNLSYVIYTSGSTGIPKGAMVHHRGIVNRLLWMQAAYGLTEEDCVLQKTPFTFDVSVWEFFWPLLAGARLVVALPGGHRDSSYLARLIAERGVTTLHFVPSMLQVFLDEPRIADCRSLRRVFCSGEALSRELQDRFFFRLDTELHNLYGPTEASVDVSFWVCRPAADRWAVPIGRPIANLRLYIVDSDTRPVPVGVAGELLIGGMGLGRGYLGRPGLTAERFIPAALGGTPGERLYRTGDLARFLPDGNVEFLGRIDYQVKIRGLRVELGEVEVALERDPAVRQAVAVVAEFAPGDRRLIAYVVAAEGGSPEAGELRRFVGESLPEYMVPTFIVPLQSLPLLSNGKVDRRALPLPAPARAEVTSSPALPTPTEEILAGFWEKILGVERVGREDDFFRLGGHSLLATQVISRIRDTFEVELPLRAIFEKPTIAALATEVERQQGAGPSLSLPPLRRLPGDGDLPLSFAQERVWLIEQLVPGNPVYNISSGLRLSGALNVPALALALSEIAGRHEALRATFHSVEGRPVQRTTPPAPLPLNVVDLSGLDAVLRDAVEHQLVAGEARRPFDLDRGPLLRASLLQLQPGEHLVHFTIHHLVADAWSLNVFSRELSTLYAAFDSGSPHGLPALPLQYADFAHWQRQWLTGDLLATELAHWEVQLAGMPPLDLPTDFPRPAVQSFRGGRRVIELPASLLQPLRRLGADSGVTGFMLLLGAFETLLQRYSGQDDAGIGFPMTNRRRTELEPLIGFFVNTLVIRMDLSKDPSFRELLARIRKAALAAYAHQELPFELLVSRLQPERDLSRNPLAQVAFQLLYGESRPVELPGLSLSRPPQAGAIARFDLELVATEVGDRLLVNVDYATDLFEHSTAERLLRHFRNLLMAAVQDPARRLSVLPMLDAAEAAQLLAVWNHQVTWEPTQSLCGLFEEHAARQPQAAAVIFETDDLSYGDLNRRANRLAHHLRELGVRAGDLVGLCTDRSLDMVVGVLGILKAGGAYLPLDPTYPRERLTYMMDDAGIPILLAQRRFRDGLARPGTTFVEVDDPGSWSGVEENPRPSATAGSVAYVIYTSGSTGRPKGVMVTHGQVVRLFSATREWFGFDAQDTWTLFHSYAFDFSVWELWGALLHGGRLVVVPYWVSRSPEALHKLLSGEGVTVLNQTPSAFQELVRSEEDLGRVDPDGKLRLVIFGGEALSPAMLRPWFDRHGAGRPLLVNMYGITETTVHVTYRPVSPTDVGSGGSPIGVPIADLQVHLVDRWQQLVPVGVPGEMLVGGAGVAVGYLSRPALTAERFVPDPFAAAPGLRLYRSGDLARRRPDGELEYLGRIDQQVKIRGFRIELGEVAALLSGHPEVETALVDVQRDPVVGDQLVAYVVLNRDRVAPPELVAELRTLARQHLPDYMVPAAFLPIGEVPLTVNGKVDRRALAALHESNEPEPAFTAARTPVEAVLAGIWCELLHLERVGIEASFFDLGGHSLLATRLIARLRQLCGVEIPLRTLFEEPTLAGFAHRVDEALAAGRGLAPAPPIEALPRTGDLPLSFGQERMWFIDQMAPGALYNMALGLRLRGRLVPELLRRAVGLVVTRHEALRTVFRRATGGAAQVVLPPEPLALPQVDLRILPDDRREAAVQQIAAAEARHPFNLAQGPLLRLTLLRLSDEQHVLLLTMHHIVGDGWSLDIFVGEVMQLYRGFVTGETPVLQPLPIQYADFARWQRQWLDSDALAALMSYWRGELGDNPPVLELPSDRPRAAMQSGRGNTLYFELPEELHGELKALGTRHGVTLFMTLLAAFEVLLGRYSGQSEFAVGTPIAGRNRVEIENLIGLFINTLALPARLDGDPTGKKLLARVRESVLGAHAHQDLPFEKLVEELRPRRSLSYSPLFQTLLVLQNTPRSAVELPELLLTRFDSDTGTAKFDLTLALVEDDRRLHAALEYDTALFEAATIERLAGHFQAVLAGLVAAPESRLSQLSLLTTRERQMLLEWNATAAESWRRPVHELIAEQAARRPQATAVVCGGAALTYGELDDRAASLARRLRRLGVGPGVLVALAVERSVEMMVGLVGIWKAGGAYVPLDPGYPYERLARMLADSGARVLVAQEDLGERLPLVADWAGEVVALDPGAAALAAAPEAGDAPAGRALLAEDLAYVIYTSGSTGGPKGVEIPHRALANFLWSMRRQPGLGADDVQVAVGSVSFDISCIELWLPLVSGARLVLATREECSEGSLLRGLLERSRATVLQATPTTWRLLLDAGWQGRDGFRIQCGGEALPPSLAADLCRQPGVLWHLYGPTETTVWSAAGALAAGDPLNVGGPIANTEIYVVDGWGNPQPSGVPGELLVGGRGLARGYHGRPELTAERFVPDPFGSRPGARLYCTGDLARRRADGRLEVLGRIDHQLKVRGFRVEPGEIEAALVLHPALSEAVVVAREGGAGPVLVAYLVASQMPPPAVDELRAFLRRGLPDYMVPSVFIMLEALPRNLNGKLDRRALPAWEGRRPELATAFAPPDTEMEKAIASIWTAALGVDEVGLHDNFFDLGGHSLLVVQVQGRLTEALGVTVPIVDMFRHATVSSLAAFLDRGRQPQEEEGLQESLDRAAARQAAQAAQAARRGRSKLAPTEEVPQ